MKDIVSQYLSLVSQKNVTWLAGLRNNIKSCQVKDVPSNIFVVWKMLFTLEDEVGTDFDTAATRIYAELFLGGVRDWIMLNNV